MVFYSLIRAKQMLYFGQFGPVPAKLFISVSKKSGPSGPLASTNERSGLGSSRDYRILGQ